MDVGNQLNETGGFQPTVEELAEKVLMAAKSNVIVSMRFMDVAISSLKTMPRQMLEMPRCDGRILYYEPTELVQKTKNDSAYATRLFLHCLFHYIFSHQYFYNKFEDERKAELFSLACDVAVEAVVLSLNVKQAQLNDDVRREDKLRIISKYVDKLTAQMIYRYFLTNDLSQDGERELRELFVYDDHSIWDDNQVVISLKQWQKLAERIKTDIKTFSKDAAKSAGLTENLDVATRQRYNYFDILRQFMVSGEALSASNDDFDYIYYTLGLRLFGNLPLVEPLESKEEKLIRDFAIVIDTSASCKGKIVKSFMQKTYDIMKSQVSYFDKVNIHIIQCDNTVQQDIRITCDEDFEEFLKNGKLTGFGGTDYRPAFDYIDQLIEDRELSNLKGIIYFTDGYGIYPDYMPSFDVLFAFLDEDDRRPQLPAWAMKVVLYEEEIDEY